MKTENNQPAENLISSGLPLPLLLFWAGRAFPGWLFVAVVIFLFQIAVCAIMHDNENVQALLGFLKVLPSFIHKMLGGAGLMGGDVAALISIGYLHPLVLTLYMFFAVGVSTNLLVGETQRGAMELILSRAVTKTQVYWCAVLPTVIGMFLLTQIMFLGTVAGTWLFDFGQPIPLQSFYKLSLNGGLLAITAGTIALFVSSWTKERGKAVGITVSYLMFDYFLKIVSSWWPPMQPYRFFTLFDYVNGPLIFKENRWPVSEMSTLTVISVTALTLGWIVWRKRDLPA